MNMSFRKSFFRISCLLLCLLLTGCQACDPQALDSDDTPGETGETSSPETPLLDGEMFDLEIDPGESYDVHLR